MAKVVVVGGGFAGCAAAVAAAKTGVEVVLLERTDMLLAAGLRAGRMNYNGKIVAAEEAKALGAGEMFNALESIILHHTNIVDEEHGYVYDTTFVEPTIDRLLQDWGVQVHKIKRAVDVKMEGPRIQVVVLADGSSEAADVFVDCTGTTGGMAVCNRYGRGCMMCLTYRCPTFGDRVSIATKAGAPEIPRLKPDGTPGAIGAAVFLNKETLDRELRRQLETQGVITIPLPPELIDYSKQERIGAVRSRVQFENLNLVDIGAAAKCVALGYFALADLRAIPGLGNVQIEEPLGAGVFNKIGKIAMTYCDPRLRVEGLENVYAAGEKCGPCTGVAEVIVTGIVAGYNAARVASGLDPVILPEDTAIGDYLAFLSEEMHNGRGRYMSFSLAHGVYAQQLQEKGFYPATPEQIAQRVSELGWANALAQF